VGLAGLGRLAGLTVAALLAVPAGASAATLYDQLDNPATSGDMLSTPSYFYENGDSDQAADDFTVPAGQVWTVTAAQAPGPPIGTFDFRVTLFADAGGKPGSQITQSEATLSASGALITFPVNAAPQLQPGHYWVSLQIMNLVSWAWGNRTVLSGSPAMWQSSTGDNGCLTWTVRTTCFPDTAGAPDQVFALQGTAAPAPTPIKKKKKCRKHKKHKRSAESAKKKKCTKKKKRR
jgi:hypothetical protein